MTHAVTIRPDEETCRLMSRLWDKLEEGGIPLGFDKTLTEPHITLSVVEPGGPDPSGRALADLRRWCRTFASSLPAIPLHFSSIGIFPNHNEEENPSATIYIGMPSGGPVADAYKAFRAGLPASCPVNDPIYQPSRWVPHITLAIGLDERQLVNATQIVSAFFRPVSAVAGDLELYEEFPVHRVLRIALGPCDCGKDPMVCQTCERVRWPS